MAAVNAWWRDTAAGFRTNPACVSMLAQAGILVAALAVFGIVAAAAWLVVWHLLLSAAPFIDRLPGTYDYEVRERGSNLSVGQRQLLAFARAIAFNPEVLLVLDEATSSVDTETEALIQTGLERLMHGRTSIVIAHRLSTVRHVDRIIVLHQGKIVEDGTHEELLALKGFYNRLYQLQFAEVQKASV